MGSSSIRLLRGFLGLQRPLYGLNLLGIYRGVSNSINNAGTKRTVKTSTVDWKPLKSKNTNITAEANNARHSKFKAATLGLMIAMPVVTFYLGCWQVRRLHWKVDLIAKCEDSLAEPPIEGLPPNLDPSVIPEYEYRRFKVKGHFDYSQEMFLGPRIRNGDVGYLLICPFVRACGGKPILVERGWISKDKVLPESRAGGDLSYLARPEGDIEIEALFRVMPNKSGLQYEHEMGSRLFHIPNVEAMARQSNTLPIYCQMIYSLEDKPEWKKEDTSKQYKSWITSLFSFGNNHARNNASSSRKDASKDATMEFQEPEFIEQGVPLAAKPEVKLRNNHLQYLITWFGLSLASAGLLLYNVFKRKKFLSAERIIQAKREDMKKQW